MLKKHILKNMMNGFSCISYEIKIRFRDENLRKKEYSMVINLSYCIYYVNTLVPTPKH